MSFNIKNEETHRLVRELAELTGESMTQAVTEAVRERLVRVRQRQRPLAEEILAIGRDSAARLREQHMSLSTDDLYDEQGLPR